jgi:hypothetical protein
VPLCRSFYQCRYDILLFGRLLLYHCRGRSAVFSSVPGLPGRSSEPQVPRLGQFFSGPRGAGVVTGNVGSMATTTIAGSGGRGLLMNNGNGTSTLIVPGGIPEAVISPR